MDKRSKKAFKLQAVVDFLSSYGLAFLVILIAIALIYKVGTSNTAISSPSCTAVPGFSCDYFAISANGMLTLKLSQAIGSPIIINGMACSSSLNSTGDKPQYGNINVGLSPAYYPTYPVGNTIYSSSSYIFNVTCYGPYGKARGSSGTSFTGFVWLNYTIAGYGQQTQRIASISVLYT